MWDSSYMADFDNFSAISENFETIKTLLNSIRAQGILNTSDVDKLLSGINAKLEKINSEEDIDLIKIFLSELKQNLDERHNVLISKFGAIESLFSNLLKTSSEMPKSSELKELFDIVATNLSVFSREVVSQKESLTDITLRLDAIRSDDSQKKDIIKNIGLLKPDLEHLNNGFNSIVLSLNDNFKSIIKMITSIDKTEYLDKFSDSLSSIEMSSNTVLSALQMLGKKTEQVEDALGKVATKDDLKETSGRLVDLAAKSQEMSATLSSLSAASIRIDNLAEKIDASVNIIASLKSVIEESENSNAKNIIDKLNELDLQLKEVSSDSKFEEFKSSMTSLINNIISNNDILDKNVKSSLDEAKNITTLIKSLDINVNIQNLLNKISESESSIKSFIADSNNKLTTLNDANITRVLNDISQNADSFGTKLSQAQSSIAVLCEKNFGSVFTNIADLKSIVSQIDENSVSANNAIFSNITDRLTVFENSLRDSLDLQEQTVSKSSAQLVEQIDNIKNLSGVLDYKMDSSVVEIGNIKREFSSLKSAVEGVLALDFVNTVKDLRVDLYASKQEMANTFENSTNDLSEKLTNDLYGKYELLISKLDSIEDELKKAQTASLAGLKVVLDNISSSIVDILSYVSEKQNASSSIVDDKIIEISSAIKENSLNYIENVRDIVDVIRVQVENNIKSIEEENSKNFEEVKKSISDNSEEIRKEVKYSYSKLLEIQDTYSEIKELLNLNNTTSSDKFEGILASANGIKSDFESKLDSLKASLLDRISEFKQEFTCENADKVSELKFSVENLYSKNSQEVTGLIEELKSAITQISTDATNSRTAALAKILDNFVSLKDVLKSFNDKATEDLATKVDLILADFSSVKSVLEKVDENIDGDMTRQLSIIESNFESLVSQITILFDKSGNALTDKINKEFNNISERMNDTVTQKLESYKQVIEETFDSLNEKSATQSQYLQERISGLNSAMKAVWEEQSNDNRKQIEEIANNLKNLLDENVKLAAVDYLELRKKLEEFAQSITEDNEGLIKNLKEQLDDITKYIDSVLEIQSQETLARHDELLARLLDANNSIQASIKQDFENQNSKFASIEETASQTKAITSNIETTVIDNHNENLTHFENIAQACSDNASLIDKLGINIDISKDDIKNDLSNIAQISGANKSLTENISSTLEAHNGTVIEELSSITKISNDIKSQGNNIEQSINNLSNNVENNLSTFAQAMMNDRNVFEGNINGLLNSNHEDLKNNILTSAQDISKKIIESLNDNNELVKNEFEGISQSVIENKSLLENINSNISSNNTNVKNEFSSIVDTIETNKLLITELRDSITEKAAELKSLSAEISAGELKTLDSYMNKILEQVELEKQNAQNYKNVIIEILKNELNTVSKDVEKETDVIIGELVEQFDILKASQADEVVNLTSRIEEIVNAHIYNNIEDLKSYLDIKTDTSVLSSKLDNLKVDMTSSVEDLLSNLNKLLDSGSFTSAMSDYRLATEIFVNSAVDRLNDKIESFINENIKTIGDVLATDSKNIEDRLALFDKNFTDTIVDKYEEIKLISNKYNDSFDSIKNYLNDILSEFAGVKNSVNSKIDSLVSAIKSSADTTNKEIKYLKDCFESLRSQISNKSFDEAFQASINKQIASLETLISEQMGYIEDINDLCTSNLPDLTEMNTIVKHSILSSIEKFSDKLDNINVKEVIDSELKQFKSDIITQFLNIFNQISFVAEQEEIIDYIQDKHDELITVLSHIVTATDEISEVKDSVNSVDTKINDIKDEIGLINEKIMSIISSEGDVDYVYSLQDLESDIANLRLVLNEMKNNDHGKEFEELVSSTNDIYKLVESIKSELPDKRDLEGIAEDIVSISTRTNKLILASDESYKTLQDNLHDFKLVINDLDERTKNFSQEAGIDRIDAKLNAINSMVVNGAKTNQVFNQVFEYLAEWVDNAGVQINAISSKVDTLDNIEQIKSMLADLKADSEDNSESAELIEALGTVFDKQTKRISSLEAKLDKIIVETTINSKRFDLSSMEDTLNKFLVALDDKITSQQDKINSLEAKLENVMSLLDTKDTAQLTKKVGGMDRQIAKLNKSIEKIASHVTEK